MDGFALEVLRRLPLAQSVLSIFAYVLSEPFLDGLFEKHRGRCYEGVLSFSMLVHLVRDALLIHEGLGRPSFQRAAAAGELPVHERSVYPKLARVEVEVSKALLRESALKMIGLHEGHDSPVPLSLQGFEVIAFDGKSIKCVRRQLKELRPLRGRLVGGKLLVAQQVRGMFPPQCPKLWMGDRQFCDLNLFGLLTEGGEHFLIRMNRTLGFTADPSRPAQKGVDARGRSYVQELSGANRNVRIPAQIEMSG